MPWLIKGGIDTALGAAHGGRSLIQYPLLILGAAALQGFFRYCWRINIHGFSRRCEADLRDRVFAHSQRLPLSYFQHTKTGDLMSRFTNDILAVRELMGFGSLAIVDAIVVILFSLTLMIVIDPWLTLWSMMAMPLIPIVVRFFGREIFRTSRETQERLSSLSAYVLENFSGIRVVQAYAQEQNQIAGFDAINAEYRRKTMWLATLWGIFWPLMLYGAGLVLFSKKFRVTLSSSALLMLGFTVIYTAIHLLSWALIRYRLPVDAVLLIFAALALVDLFSRARVWLARPDAQINTTNQGGLTP